MRCYFILVKGKLDWLPALSDIEISQDTFRPDGFYCHRYILASSPDTAREAAFRKARVNLDAQFGWLKAGMARLELTAEETTSAPIYRFLMPDNRGHSFYLAD